MKLFWFVLLFLLSLVPSVLGSLDLDLRLEAGRTAIRNPAPGAPALESTALETRMELHDAWSFLDEQAKVSWTYRGRISSQPGGPGSPPPEEGALFRGAIVEASLGWEPLLGVLIIHGGKRLVQDSRGFAFKVLDLFNQGTEAQEGVMGLGLEAFLPGFSLAAWYLPQLEWPTERPEFSWYVGKSQPLAQAYLNLSTSALGVDATMLGLVSPDNWKAGLGLGSQVGDSLTLRGEVLYQASWPDGTTLGEKGNFATMAGASYTWEDGSTLMAEHGYHSSKTNDHRYFLRYSRTLGDKLSAEALVVYQSLEPGGFHTLSLDQAWDHGGISFTASQAWKHAGVQSSNPWLWTISTELRVLY